MRLSFTLNGKRVNIDAPAAMRLVDLLHDRLEINSLHPSCYAGECGNCAILLDGELTYSCIVPVFSAQGRTINTFEGISLSPEYEDITAGFRDEKAYPCAYCLPSKVIITQSILEKNLDPKEEEIMETLAGTYCPCTNFRNLTRGIMRAASYRRRRLYDR
jgi:aerobic-type carbon monoxide dehydrogenase small subunit (CoxS/CutS family)